MRQVTVLALLAAILGLILAACGTEPVPDLNSEQDHFRSAGWSRGSGNMQEALTLSYVDSAQAGTAFFVVALFAK